MSYLGKFSLLQMAKYLKIFDPSGPTASRSFELNVPPSSLSTLDFGRRTGIQIEDDIVLSMNHSISSCIILLGNTLGQCSEELGYFAFRHLVTLDCCESLDSIFFLKGPTPASFSYIFVFSNTHYKFYKQIGMWKNVHPVYGAGIRTHNLWNMSLLP